MRYNFKKNEIKIVNISRDCFNYAGVCHENIYSSFATEILLFM